MKSLKGSILSRTSLTWEQVSLQVGGEIDEIREHIWVKVHREGDDECEEDLSGDAVEGAEVRALPDDAALPAHDALNDDEQQQSDRRPFDRTRSL